MLTIPNHRLLTFGFIAFILIGLEQGLLGLFMADMGTLLARSPEDLGLFFALHGLGSAVVTGSALVGSLERVNSKRIAMASLALSLGSALIVMGDAWILKLIAAPLLGAGFGGLSMSFNTLFVTYFSQKNAGLLNVLNATYGLGAVAAPWLLSQGLLSGGQLFAFIAVLSLVVMLGAWNIDDRVPNTAIVQDGNAELLRIYPLLVTAFLMLFLEAGLTYWLPSLLSASASGEGIAAAYMSQFFFWFVIVRLSAAALATWVTTLGFALCGLVGISLSLGAVLVGAVALADTSFTGAFMGLIFPNAYAWMLKTGGGGTSTGARVLLSAIAGATVGPWVLGWILPIGGEASVLWVLGLVSTLAATVMVITELNARKYRSMRSQ